MNTTKTGWLIDVTSMNRILRELELHDKITGVIDVRDNDLATIADMGIDDGTDYHDRSQELIKLIEEDKVYVFFNPYRTKISPYNAVECIRLEPFYYVKDLNKLYK